MSASSLVIVGGGEHARVVIEAARSGGEWQVVGFSDPRPCEDTARRMGVTRLGSDDETLAAYATSARFVLGIGAIGVDDLRRRAAARYDTRAVAWGVVVHRTAWISPSATLSPGVVVMAGATVNAGAHLGRHTVVNTGAVIEHDVRLGDFAQVGPRAALGGGVTIGDGAYIGLGAAVRDHVSVGARSLVGMGGVVTRNVPEGAVMAGVPARSMTRAK